MKELGTGRTKLGRFAMVTVPALGATAALGLAIVNGAVGAALATSSANGFQVKAPSAKADSLALVAGTVSVIGASSNTDEATALTKLKGANITGLCMAADSTLPIIGTVGLKISTDPTAVTSLASIDLNGKSVKAATANITASTQAGVARSTVDGTTYANGGGNFALATDQAAAANSQKISLTTLDATSYALDLPSGINLTTLNITPVKGTTSC